MENKTRPFGYGINYQNVTKEALHMKDNFILALDKHHYKYIDYLNEPTIVLHDAIEIDYFKKNKEITDKIRQCKRVICIRERIKDYISDNLGVESEYLYHPFYKFPLPNPEEKTGGIAMSRVDWDKHTDIICKANKLLPKEKEVEIRGAVNRLYEFHKLKELGFDKYYKGKFDKSFDTIGKMLNPKKFMVDLTIIRNDGGGTQYTFLEAIHANCCLILHKKWIENGGDFIPEKNCLAVENEQELAKILNDNPDVSDLVKNSKKILDRNTNVDYKIS